MGGPAIALSHHARRHCPGYSVWLRHRRAQVYLILLTIPNTPGGPQESVL